MDAYNPQAIVDSYTAGEEISRVDRSSDAAIMFHIERWFIERDGKENGQISADQKAALNALDDFFNLDLKGIIIRIDNTVSAMGTTARLTAEMGLLNIEMAFARFKGLYQFLDRECARKLFVGRFEFINKESDMGLAGLKQAKRSCHPVSRVKCFKLSIG